MLPSTRNKLQSLVKQFELLETVEYHVGKEYSRVLGITRDEKIAKRAADAVRSRVKKAIDPNTSLRELTQLALRYPDLVVTNPVLPLLAIEDLPSFEKLQQKLVFGARRLKRKEIEKSALQLSPHDWIETMAHWLERTFFEKYGKIGTTVTASAKGLRSWALKKAEEHLSDKFLGWEIETKYWKRFGSKPESAREKKMWNTVITRIKQRTIERIKKQLDSQVRATYR